MRLFSSKLLVNVSVVHVNHRGMGEFTKRLLLDFMKEHGEKVVLLSNRKIDPDFLSEAKLLGASKMILPCPLPILEQLLIPLLCIFLRPQACYFPSNTFSVLKVPGTKYVATIHDLIFMSDDYLPNSVVQRIGKIYRKITLIWGIRVLDKVSSVSRTALSEIESRFSFRDDVVEPENSVLYNSLSICNGYQDSILSKYSVEEGKYFYSISGISPNKNLPFLLRSFSKFSEQDSRVKLVVTGVKGELSEYAIDRVVFTDYVSDDEKRSLISNSLALVMPSKEEGFGIPILEGLYYNGRVIASDIPVFREIGEEMIEYFDPHDETSLCEVLSTDKIVDKIEAKNYVTRRFSVRDSSRKLTRLLGW
jgi:glycosyltransferase involved in cell wall biosynthesis